MTVSGEELVFRMKIDPSELRAWMGGGGGAVGRPGSVAAGGGDAGVLMGTVSGTQRTNPAFMSVFKPLASLLVIEKLLGVVASNSKIVSTYMSAMGKTFGAAIDLLMTPFIPLFNLLLVGLNKLIAWLITSGALEKLQELMANVSKNIEAMVNWVAQVYRAVKELDFSKLAHLFWQGTVAGVKEALAHPLEAIATALTLLAAAYAANKFTGGVLGKAGTMVLGGSGGGTVAGGAAKPGMLGRLGAFAKGVAPIAGPVGLGMLAGYGLQKGYQQTGLPGSDTSAGAGRLLQMYAQGNNDKFFQPMYRQMEQQGITREKAAQMVNSGNTYNITQNITGNNDPKATADEAKKQLDDELGRKLSLR